MNTEKKEPEINISDLEFEEITKAYKNEESNSEFESETEQQNFQSFEKAVIWIVKNIDSFLKQKGLEGFGDLSHEQLGELILIVAERNVPTEFLKKTPEFMLGSIMLGVLVQNYMAFKKLDSKKADSNKAGKDE